MRVGVMEFRFDDPFLRSFLPFISVNWLCLANNYWRIQFSSVQFSDF